MSIPESRAGRPEQGNMRRVTGCLACRRCFTAFHESMPNACSSRAAETVHTAQSQGKRTPTMPHHRQGIDVGWWAWNNRSWNLDTIAFAMTQELINRELLGWHGCLGMAPREKPSDLRGVCSAHQQPAPHNRPSILVFQVAGLLMLQPMAFWLSLT